MSKQITSFKQHIDNAQEKITAGHINHIQQTINNAEKEHLKLADEQFRSFAFFSLESSLFANSMFLDDLKTPYKVLFAQSSNIAYDQEQTCIKVADNGNVMSGEMVTVKLSSQYPTVINEFSLVVDHHIPKGAVIRYYVSTDGGKSYFPIKPNVSEPTVLNNKGNDIFLKVQLFKNKDYESPRLFGWCLLYRDPIVEKMFSLGHIELSKLDQTVVGETILFRNKKNEDRLEVIVTPSGLTELYYDSEDEKGEKRLSHILERNEDKIIKQTMNYGDYEDSTGHTEEVLISITTSLEKVEESETEGDGK